MFELPKSMVITIAMKNDEAKTSLVGIFTAYVGLYLRVIILFSIILVCNAHASMDDSNRLKYIKLTLSELGYRIPSEDILSQIVDIDKKSEHKLSPDGILESAKFIAESKGVELSKASPSCFTCTMRVLTPVGYIEIQKLSVGDEVLSWDTGAKKYVRNEITQIHHITDQIIGELHSTESIKPIEVTPSHRFYTPETDEYRPISEVPPGTPLLGFNPINACKKIFSSKTSYRKLNSLRDVFNLSLKKNPRNFIVEGVLVHNVKFGA